MRTPAGIRSRFLSSPFGSLVAHFIKRLFANEEEQDGSTMGLGVGAVLALVASPGAFASIFLMGKYSTLLQWMRGEHLDPIRRSPSDEYFFIVLSMTITGLVMVARWNRLFPDTRDFSNLAVLPIPIRNIFLANLAALTGLALLFAFDANAVSAILFPLFVTISDGSAAAFFRVASAHALTVLSASLFSFFLVFALVGVLMSITPRRIFRPASLLLRMLLVIGLLTEFFSNMFVQLFNGRLPGSAASYMRYLPSLWFLGIYEKRLGIAKSGMMVLAHQAALVLAGTIAVSIVAYALCYRRVFMRLPESLDSLGGSRRDFRLRIPEAIAKPLYRSSFERACSSFAFKVLTRSEQHVMFFGAYLGMGLVMVARTALDAPASAGGSSLASPEQLAIPLLVALFIVSGLRFAFDLPAACRANWLFQTAANSPQPDPRKLAKRLMLWATLPWQVLLVLPITMQRSGWTVAITHTAILIAFTGLFIDAVLIRFHKIPFTCSTQLDIKQLIVRTLTTMFAVLLLVPGLASIEHWVLEAPLRAFWFALFFPFAWYVLWRWRSEVIEGDEAIQFVDGPGPVFELLKLNS